MFFSCRMLPFFAFIFFNFFCPILIFPSQELEALLQSTVGCLLHTVEKEDVTLASLAMEALGHIGLRCSLSSVSLDSSQGTTFPFVLKQSIADILLH